MEDLLENNYFTGTLEKNGRFPLCAAGIDILQVNLGYRCNLACKHCHVQAGPLRTEMMARENVESIIHTLENSPIRILDLTGGAPELHSNFRFLVTAARAIGVRFNQLYTLANMPLGRFKDFLVRSKGYDAYMEKLRKAFNPSTLDGIMCRRLVSVDWDGILFDCDFNLVAGLPVEEGCPRHIRDFDYEALSRRKIVLSEHCFGCTAGQGST